MSVKQYINTKHITKLKLLLQICVLESRSLQEMAFSQMKMYVCKITSNYRGNHTFFLNWKVFIHSKYFSKTIQKRSTFLLLTKWLYLVSRTKNIQISNINAKWNKVDIYGSLLLERSAHSTRIWSFSRQKLLCHALPHLSFIFSLSLPS